MPDAGKLAFGLGTTGIDCTIVDASETGAKVLIGIDPSQVPNDLILIYLRKQLAYEAAVVRRTDNHLGLKFTRVLERYDLSRAGRDAPSVRGLAAIVAR